MRQTWLRPNLRLHLFRSGALLVLAMLCGGVLGWLWPAWVFSPLGGAAAGLVLVLCAALCWLTYLYGPPRLWRRGDVLLIKLGRGRPIAAPLEFIEVFFLGQMETQLVGKKEPVAVSALVVRLAERAADWQQRPVDPKYARWCGGYITINGAYTEPINVQLLTLLNDRLREIHRERKRLASAGSA